MNKQILSGVMWCVYNSIFQLQKLDVLPNYPWDSLETEEEKELGYDQAFGGEWKLLEQKFVFQWDAPSNTLPTKPIKLELVMRGELPIDRHTQKPIKAKEAQRRWFVSKMRVEKPTGKKIGKVDEMIVVEAQSKDDVMNLIKQNEA